MHWGSSFFVLFCLLGLAICLLPVRLQFHAQHQQQWQGDFTIRLLGLHYTKTFGEQQKSVHKQNQKSSVPDDMHSVVHNTFYPHWRAIVKFFWQAGHVVLRQLSLEQLSLRCNIGFQQPDRTAYSYALFWAVLAVLPPKWLEQADITYVPDFQQQKQDIQLQGIICASVGQVIRMIALLFWLVMQAKLEQDRKEQMVYES